MHYPEETQRGTPFALERIRDEQPSFMYWMTAAPNGFGEPSWEPAEADFDWNDQQVRGPGPDVLELPDDLAEGEYRLCTVNRPGNMCSGRFIVDD